MATETLCLEPGVTVTVAGIKLELTEPTELVGTTREGTGRKRVGPMVKALCPSGCELSPGVPYSVLVGRKVADQIGLPLCPLCRTVMVQPDVTE